MTLYLDSSSLVKLYVDEPESPAVARLAAEATVVTTSVVAYAEVCAALARLKRERRLTSLVVGRLIKQVDLDWGTFLTVEVTDALSRAAGLLADRLALRGFDAIHLASFELVAGRSADEDVRFSSADSRLTRAAKRLV